jgi:hypothetical protein
MRMEKTMKSQNVLIVLCIIVQVFAIPVFAAGEMAGPILGYATRGATLRPILGIPGASYFGAAFDTTGLEIAAVSSIGGYAIAFSPDRADLRILAFRSGVQAQSVVLEKDGSTVDAISLSPEGLSLALVRGRSVDIFTGLPFRPQKHKTLSLPSGHVQVAVSDDGDAVAISEGGTLLSVFEGERYRQLGTIELRHVSFRPASHDLVYVDGDSVIAESNSIGTVVAGMPDGVSDVRSVVLSRDSRYVFILNAGARQLLVVGSGVPNHVDLPCEASTLERLSDSALRLSCVSTGRVHLVDVSERGPRVLFIPEPVE